MGRMATETAVRRTLLTLFPALPITLVALGYLIFPLALVITGSLGNSEAGFRRGISALGVLTLRSILLALVPAFLATAFSCISSLFAVFHPWFRRNYRKWLLVMLFTNPVFIVFGLAVMLSRTPPQIAVVVASTYILMPFCGQIIQAAVDDFDSAQIRAARSLGATRLFIVTRHILPFVRQQATASVLLCAIYALGFFLVPIYVGLGRVTTLSTVIYTLTNSVGDWTAACQLCIVALTTQLVLILCWLCATRFWVSSRSHQ